MINGMTALGYAPDRIGLIKIGTTIATNTIIMRTGAKTALVTTQGFKDVLHAARASRPTLYDSDWDPAPALVARKDTLTVRERTAYDGELLELLDEADMKSAMRTIKDRGIEAVAISFPAQLYQQQQRNRREILRRARAAGLLHLHVV